MFDWLEIPKKKDDMYADVDATSAALISLRGKQKRQSKEWRDLMEYIKREASKGEFHAYVHEISEESIMKLEQMGYEVDAPMKDSLLKHYIISWKKGLR